MLVSQPEHNELMDLSIGKMRLEKKRVSEGNSQSSMKELGGVEDNPDPSSMRLKLLRHTVLTAMALWPIGARLSFSHFKIKGTSPLRIKMVLLLNC